ncbi:site-2 protease family protein [Candidatus Nomurabacteria bacterium]|nr:site-2 protease family protein [Candidatus Nomurabacteria bacterium]
MDLNLIFSHIILIMSVVAHELAHGLAANALGDPTPRLQGRLTLNPLKHLDLFGSVIFPAISYFLGGFIFGWAKPVQFNPYNLKNQKWGEAIISIAGPATNLSLAVIFGLLIRFSQPLGLSVSFIYISMMVVIINLVLTIFNLIPIPPLDGSKILFAILPERFYSIRENIEKYGFIIVIVFIVFIWQFLFPLVVLLFKLITGLSGVYF